MTDEERQRNSDKIAERRNEEMEAAVAAFVAGLSDLIASWRDDIDALLGQDFSRAHPAQLANFLENQISAQLSRSDYNALITDLLNEYDGSYDSAAAQIDALGLNHDDFDAADLDALKDIDRSRLSRTGTDTVMALAESVLIARVLRQPAELADQSVNHVLDIFRTNASRLAETGMFSFNRAVTWIAFANKTDAFLYSGPLDERTRVFCREHIGRTYTRAQIQKMSNGMSAPWNDVAIFAGGINCRHSWVPRTA